MTLKWNDFVGNGGVTTYLSSRLRSGSIPNALFLEGESGVGKTALAQLFANALLCSGEGEKPCLHCNDCREFASGGHPDLFVAQGSGKTASISVAAIRALIQDAYILPHQSERKVYFIDDAQRMTPQAQNALLKVLEEPPAHVVFLLTCPSRFDLLETILSRTQVFTLFPLTPAQALDFLSARFPGRRTEELKELASRYQGNLGKILSALDIKQTELLPSALCQVPDALTGGDEYRLMMALSVFDQSKEQLSLFLSAFRLLIRDALVHRSGGKELLSLAPSAARKLADSLTQQQCLALLELVSQTETQMERNVYLPLVLTRFCSALWEKSR